MLKVFKKYLFVVVITFMLVLTSCDLLKNQTTTEQQTTTTTEEQTTTTTEDPNIALVAEAKTSLILGDLSQVKDNLTLPTQGRHGTTITWASSNTDVLSNDGVVVRPEFGSGNATLTLTATITLGDVSDTKEFSVRVIEAPEKIGVTVEGVLDQDPDTEIALENVTVLGVIGDGYYVGDETGNIFVYTSDAPSEDVVVGDKVNLLGTFVLYYGQPEIEDPNGYTIVSSNNELPEPEQTTIATINDPNSYDLNVRSNYAKLVQVEGFVQVEDDTAYIVDSDGNELEINYNSNEDAVKAFVGKKVKIDLIFHTYRTDLETFRMSYVDGTLEEVVMTPQEKLDAAKALINLPYGTMTDLNLITTDLTGDVTIEWSVPAEQTVFTISQDGSTAVVSRPADASEEVTLTATLTIDNLDPVVVTKDVTVIETNPSPISEVLAANKYDWFTVEGIVFGVQSDGYYISDGTNSLFVYTDEFDVEVNDVVKLVGQLDIYNDQPELTNILETSESTSTITAPTAQTKTFTDLAALDSTNPLDYNQYVTLTGFVKIEGSYNNVFIYDHMSGDKVEIYYNSDETLIEAIEAFEGDFVTLDVVLHSYRSDHWRVSVISDTVASTTVSDADLLTGAQAILDLPAEVFADITLPATDLTGNVSITWESLDTSVISNAGVVTPPASGNVDVTLRATLSIGTEQDVTKDITVTVFGSPYTVTEVYNQGYPTHYTDYTTTYVTGIVSALTDEGYLIQDLDGTTISVDDSNNTVEVGDEVKIIGDYNVDYSRDRITNVSALTVVSEENAVTHDTQNAIVFDRDIQNYSDYYNKLVKFEGTIWARYSGIGDTSYLRIGLINDINDKAYDGKYLGLQVGANKIALGDNWLDSFTGEAVEYTGTIYAYMYDCSSSYYKFIVVDPAHLDLDEATVN